MVFFLESFFYQLYIHSWIRNNGPRDAEYLVVGWQILLALLISCIATIFWTNSYSFPYKPTRLNINNLNNLKSANASTPTGSITVTKETLKYITISTKEGSPASKDITIFNGDVTLKEPGQSKGTITIRVYSVTLQAGDSAEATIRSLKPATFTVTKGAERSGTVEITLTAEGTLPQGQTKTGVTLELTASPTATITPETPEQIYSGTVTFSEPATSGSNQPVNIKSVTLIFSTSNISNISGSEPVPKTVTVKGYTCSPKHGHYIYGISKVSTGTSLEDKLWNTEWDGGKCEFVECYYKDSGTTNGPVLLRFYVRVLGSLKIYYCGKNGAGDWKTLAQSEDLDTRAEIKEKKFLENFDKLVTTGELSGSLGNTPSDVYAENYNTKYSEAFSPPTLAPLIMQGLSVGAVGSIFPNLIPKTLTCARTTRTLSVMNMFMVTVPHIFNVMLPKKRLLHS